MLKRQEASFSTFTQLILESTNKRCDTLMAEIQELKISLKYSQKDIDELKADQKEHSAEAKDLANQVLEIKSKKTVDSNDNFEKLDYLENQTRRNNLVIEGIKTDKADETWAETETKVNELVTSKLKLDPDTVEIEGAHRNGKFRGDPEKPRPVVVKLLRFKDKQLIMTRARANLRNTSVYINEDFSDQLRKKCAELLPAMREARARGDYAIISYDRLIVKPRREGRLGAN